MRHWLMKSEPNVYSIQDLHRDRETLWDGVRNYQARNFLREMQVGDLVFFYHSNTSPPGVIGLACVSQIEIDDPTQFDPKSDYYDPKSTREAPRWQTVKVTFVEKFPALLALETLRQTFSPEDLWVVRPGNRLSVMPVSDVIADQILRMAR
jgi:predicted RNA-binding protein with PUA-like domain